MEEVFQGWRPDVVFHAAAYKHVPLMEVANAWQAARNNVLGNAASGGMRGAVWRVSLCADLYRQGGQSDERHGCDQAHGGNGLRVAVPAPPDYAIQHGTFW